MREQPTGPELLEAVAQFLREEVLPQLSGRTAYHLRVAANAVDLVCRELLLGRAAGEGEAARLAALLGQTGEPAALNRALCHAIASEAVDPADPALIAHLWATTLAAVAIDQPSYATYRREAEEPDAQP